MLPSTIAAANAEVMRVMNGYAALPNSSLLTKKGCLQPIYARVQGKVARYGIENGNCRAARKFSSTDKVIDESSVRG